MRLLSALLGILILSATAPGKFPKERHRVPNRAINAFARGLLRLDVSEVRMYGVRMSTEGPGGIW